ncbi:two-component system sensor histidine kinase KdpD [Curtobacterium sp. PhB130]|uniref:ATP-binding protein n=1 Tax=Curtobacterium sp. PhB130 TaxID=2485178 RepID=UPI000F4D0013|nr:ATP-binding protein [Curtobacterium sp. PhB130]ROS77625.1 two-component system sensor histidine kinase KdpD [Curtobacterium sp. PhB130]
MKRGKLRVLLGAAPGVGKTFTMLEEGRRLRDEGRDVVVAVVETHGRAATAALVDGLETVARRTETHRGVELDDLDLDAVLARHPEVALVDELAHTNAPGGPHEKRWQDVEALLAAGIDVISTVNIQHMQSLGDVVREITGTVQRETVPDAVVRGADQIEVVDLSPQALRERLSDGLVYPAARIDAALSNYFRLGNLTALREIALLWLADEVDDALKRYRAEHGIEHRWEARERVLVALTGGPEGETLLRRGARIAARSSGGELAAVHVTTNDGLRERHPGALGAQRALLEQLGGTYHQVVGDDVPSTLVRFARSIDATQIVVGVSRRSRAAAALTGPGIGNTVVRESGDIDVHVVTHERAGGGFALPRLGGSLSRGRITAAFVLALVAGPLLTLLLSIGDTPDAITVDVLAYQLLVLVVALVGGMWPAVFAAVLSGLSLDFFFVQPLHRVTVQQPWHLVALVMYVISAVLVSFVVDRSARRSRAARRAAAESGLLIGIAGSVLRGDDALQALVDRTREAFGFTGLRVRQGDLVPATSGAFGAAPDATTSLPSGAVLEFAGAPDDPTQRRLLRVVEQQIDAAVEHRDLTRAAVDAERIAAADRVRSAILAAVGHDVRRPIAAASAAVQTLRASDIALSDTDREALLATADESLGRLAVLLGDLLDVSRVQAGVVASTPVALPLETVVAPALDELELGPDDVDLDLPAELPQVLADPVLLQRVLVNLLANAVRFTPSGTSVRVAASAFDGAVELRVVDHGPGIPEAQRNDVFQPFQRLGDTDNDTGLGLGLALARGFTEGMGGSIEADDTPGGGLTMVVRLPIAGHIGVQTR